MMESALQPLDEVGMYLLDMNYQIQNTSPFSDDKEEHKFVAVAASGNLVARERVVTANLPLVVSIARLYLGRGLSFADLIQEGNLGLLHAIEAFDSSRGVYFGACASYWIKQDIRRAIVNQAWPVRLYPRLARLVCKWLRAKNALSQKLGRLAEDDEVSKSMNLGKRKRETLMRALIIQRHGMRNTLTEEYQIDPLQDLEDETSPPDVQI